MSNSIRIKRRLTGLAGAPAGLKNGELAFNEVDNNLYYGKGDDGSQNATSIVTVAGPGAFAAVTSDVTPSALGTAAAGTSSLLARADHVHAMPLLSDVGAPTANINLNGQRIVGLADPVNGSDAATKSFVEAVAQGLDVKDSVRVASIANIPTLSGLLIVDGVTTVTGDRVLIKDQTNKSTNGIYIVATGAWTRAVDADAWTELPGAFTFVEQGTQAGSGWVCTAVAGGTIDSTDIDFTQFSGAGTIQGGDGIDVSGNIVSAVGTSDRIDVTALGIDIASTYVGQTSITTLGTVTTGTWSASIDGTSIDGGTF